MPSYASSPFTLTFSVVAPGSCIEELGDKKWQIIALTDKNGLHGMDEHALAVVLVGPGELSGSEKVTPVLGGDVGLTGVELSGGTDLGSESIAPLLAEMSSHIGLAGGVDIGIAAVEDGADIAHLDGAAGAAVERVHPDVVLLEGSPAAVMFATVFATFFAAFITVVSHELFFGLPLKLRLLHMATELAGGHEGDDGDDEDEGDHGG